MYITARLTGKKHTVTIQKLDNKEFKLLSVKTYAFNWKELRGKYEVYKITKENDPNILGLMALSRDLAEERLEIHLIAVSVENKGKNKIYDRIVGCLIAFACMEALKNYIKYPCVSLIPKTGLKDHYKMKYNMLDGGWQLYLEGLHLAKMIKDYYYEH